MSMLLLSSAVKFPTTFSPSPSLKSSSSSSSTASNASFVSTRSRTKKKKKQKQTGDDSQLTVSSSSSWTGSLSVLEKGLRLTFMDELMERARDRDPVGVSNVIYDMVAAGLKLGPRSFHGLIVSYVLCGDEEGAMQSLRRELSGGLVPLHETFISLIRLFGSKGHATSGLEILAAMERLDYDIRKAWLVLVEHLVRNNHLDDANQVFLKGAEGGLRATDEIYDLIIQEDCKAGDHSNALTIAYEMEAAGRMATTFHFNCLLSVQATCGIPEIALATFENMEYGGEDYMKPDTETYNWLIQAYTRAETYDRVQDVAELLGMMVEDHKRLQPNMKTYALLVECFTKYCVVNEAIRHFRALKTYPGGTKLLHNEGNFDDPLSLYLRALCREGRIVELLEALEAMAKDNQPISPRAMILNRKYRTLVSSWIEPLQEEADVGFEIDYVARYIDEGGLTGERKRWVPRRGKTPLDPDVVGFAYSNPIETSFKRHCLDDWKSYHHKVLKTLRNNGYVALIDVSEYNIRRVEERLKKIIKGPDQNALKPKAASKMIVIELKEELEAQGLPIDGTRQVLYQRVQKARRINRSRGRPLWVPPVEEEEEEVDEELEELISRIKLNEGDTEFWKRRFLGEGLRDVSNEVAKTEDSKLLDISDGGDIVDDVTKEADDEEVEEEEEVEEVEQNESQVDARVKEKGVERAKPLQMIGVQLLKDSDQTSAASARKARRQARFVQECNDDDDDWFPEDIYEAFKEMRKRRIFDVKDMYTIADAWGWTWEIELKKITPRKWSQDWEVELAVKVIQLGGTPTIGDCAMVLRSAIKAPFPSAFLRILQTTHNLGYTFGSPLYDEIITLCLDLGELDAAVAIVADMETTGITIPDETIDKVLLARQGGSDTSSNES
ncbi:putative Pentatricopeptide repeat-containing protein [Zostera marina]|uniref:Putative Pentatricopeptide repeat-containing protein n=1 Tax=Zostera marina TaxID=29655 RepID=A0A0K9PUW3_ZOSMR|nr:putative Pentatricopeptide repeat-containing protein [Zostera marina]